METMHHHHTHHHHPQQQPITKADKYWQDSPGHQYDRNLNFAAIGSEDDDYGTSFNGKSKAGGGVGNGNNNSKTSRDPQSHRIIEKRRRDRMNNCLADLSRLLPPACMKKGRGRIEKTEIIEMTIKHMKHLQVHACKEMENCEIALQMEQTGLSKSEHYRTGFLECISETMEFVSQYNLPSGAGDDFASRLFAYLHTQCDKFTRAASDGNVSDPGGDLQPSPAAAEPTSRKSAGVPAIREDDAVPPTTSPAPMEDRFTGGGGNNKDIQDRVHSVFNYLGGSDNPCSMRQVKRRPSGSGHDSDETNNTSTHRSDQGTRNSSTPSPGEGCGSSPRTCTDTDNNSSHSGASARSSSSSSSSQLRQMLLSNGEEAASVSTKSCSSSCSTGSGRRSSNHEADGTYKKFKTNIHQRFTADMEHDDPQAPSCLLTPASTTSSSEPHQELSVPHGSKRKMSDYDERYSKMERETIPPPSSPSSTGMSRGGTSEGHHHDGGPLHKILESAVVGQPLPMPIMAVQGSSENVPIFALHPKGSYYVPMSIEMSMIQSHFQIHDPTSATPLLHPVTISVNFCHPLRVLAASDILKVIGPSVTQSRNSAQEQVPVAISRPIASPPLYHRSSSEMEDGGRGRMHQHLRTPRPVLREDYVNYHYQQTPSLEPVTPSAFRTRDYVQQQSYPISRSSQHQHSHQQQQQHFGGTMAVSATAPTPAAHSSRWSHLMAKRTHTP